MPHEISYGMLIGCFMGDTMECTIRHPMWYPTDNSAQNDRDVSIDMFYV